MPDKTRTNSGCKFFVMARKALVGMTSALLAFSAAADDIEIYTNQEISGGAPSVLFIMDTSGSMDSEVYVTNDYDPQTDYSQLVPGGSTACRNDRLYWRRPNSSIPGCGTSRYFAKSTNRCNASWIALDMDNETPGLSSSTNSTGSYTDRWTRYDDTDNYWWRLNSSLHGAPRHTHAECRTDQDNGNYHGQATGDGSPYIYSYSPPYKSSYTSFTWTGSNGRSRSYVVYAGNWLNYYHYYSNQYLGTRMGVVKDALQDLITNVPTINAGLMEFDYNDGSEDSGGAVTSAMANMGLAGSEARQNLIDRVEAMSAAGWTPLAETLHEAYQYWTGGAIEYGDNSLVSVAESRNPENLASGVYASQFQTDCSENYQVLLTDGQPTRDARSDFEIREFINDANSNDAWLSPPLIATNSCDHSEDNSYGSCLDDLAEVMNKTDLTTGDSPNINHTVTTYTIGFDISSNTSAKWLLERTAEHGGGQFFEANDSTDLANAFQETIAQILEKNASFSSPAISVNALNRLVHNDELYFALFEPGDSEHWPGNIKRYKLEFVTSDLDGNGTVEEGEGEYEIVDVNGNNAIDPDTAQIKDTATSWWNLSGEADGNEVIEGGIAHRLFDWDNVTETFTASTRASKVFTYVRDYDLDEFSLNHEFHPEHGKGLKQLHEDKAAIDILDEEDSGKPIHRSHFGLPDSYEDADFLKLVQWSRGVDTWDYDVDGDLTEGRPQYGAPLHAKPVVVTYAADFENDTQTNVVFSITNDGYFHAAKTKEPNATGRMEYFAFIPGPLLKNLEVLAEDAGTEPVYGLDGGLTIWRNDVDNDGNIETSDDDHVIAYFGQRRGGRAVFALNVTNLNTPKLLWVIDPDSPNQAADARFAYMGQSWAAPQRAKMLVGDADNLVSKDVVVISGGYDDDHQDSDGAARMPNGDETGGAIYIVDAFAGELYWWGSKTESEDPQDIKLESDDMKWGFTGAVRLVDINGDEIIDMMFAADNGGQVWRFDIENQLLTTDSKFLIDRISGGVIADFQKADEFSDLTAANNRRFYYTPDIALVGIEDSSYLTIALGSGYRAHPLDEDIDDRFYMIRDYNVTGPPLDEAGEISYTLLYENDLLDVTNINLADEDTTLTITQENKLRQGWLLRMGDNEKVLATSITIAGSIIFTTYTPPEVPFDAGSCSANIGSGAAYIVRIDDARPLYDLAAAFGNELTKEDRQRELKSTGIPAEPLPVYTEGPNGNEAVVLVGKETLPVNVNVNPNASYWYQEEIR